MTKTNALIFPSEDALLVALTSGIVPGAIQATRVRFAREPGGAIAIVPEVKLPREVSAALSSAGVHFGAKDASFVEARCWAEVLRATPLPESAVSMHLVLFFLDGDVELLELAGELLRLGCDRQAYALERIGDGTRALLRASDPPYYTVASAIDRGGRFRAFVPIRPGQELVFAEIGWSHPLKETIHPPPGEILLIPREGPWLLLKNGPWSDIYGLIDFRLPESPEKLAPIAPPRRLTVPLRLTRASRSEPASLWVIRDRAIEVVDRLVQSLPDDVVARLLFAVTGDAERPIVVLRGRAGRGGPPEIDVPGEAYVSLLRIPNLFVPRDRIVEPPLRRDKIRELLAPSDEEIGWLAPREGSDGFRLESMPDDAFSPLPEWVEYLVEANANRLEPWVRSALFDFEPFVSVGVEWADQPKPVERKEKPKPRPERRAAPAVGEIEGIDFDDDTDPAGSIPPREPDRSISDILQPVEGDALTPDEALLDDLEQHFLELDAPLDAPERSAMWAEMARLNGRLNRHRDAGICWAYALWEQSGERAAAIAREWAEVDTGAKDPPAMISLVQGSLQASKPSRGDVRDVVAVIVSSHLAHFPEPSALGDIHDVQVWLDRHDDVLDVRSLWLARHALAELVGGDRLALARTRDRILARLRVGLSLERDVPNFLRFLGNGRGGRSSEQLADRLEELLLTYMRTPRKRNVLEAPEALTGAYVRLVFAFGFARLGRSDRARGLREEARAALDLEDPVHGFLVDAFHARIDQALEGKPLETPLPPELGARLKAFAEPDVTGLDPAAAKTARSKALMVCYKIDSLREVSSILEPHEKFNSIDVWQKRHQKERGGLEFEQLRGVSDPDELAEKVDALLELALRSAPDEHARLFDGLMDFFPQLPARAKRNLERVLASIDRIDPGKRALILQDALMLAGYFGLSDLAQRIAAVLTALLAELDAKQVVEVALEFRKSLRALRRVGLKQEAADLLETMQRAITGDGPDEMVARVQLAGGSMSLGDLERAMPVMTAAHQYLDTPNLKVETRLRLHQALASAWSEAPEQTAVAGLASLVPQLKLITDGRTGNSHFCRSVIQFMEALVLGYASENLALGELGRRWLDEDEYLIRRRIHRTVGA